MTIHSKLPRIPLPNHGSPERLGLVSALVLSLVSLGGVMAMLAGALTMQVQTRAMETRGRMATMSAQSSDLQKELASLDHRLQGVWDQLLEARLLVGKARFGDRDLPADVSPAGDVFGTPLDETLREAREVSDCFEDLLARMEVNASAWEGLPTILPLDHAEITSPFGLRRDPLNGQLDWHPGMDLSAPMGTPVHAPAAGVVTRSGYFGDYGLMIEIDHGNGLTSRYGHLSRVNVRAGDRVSRQDLLGQTGATGRVSAPHLHYEIQVAGRPVNPEPYIMNELYARESGSTLNNVTAAPQQE
jgi:murein DD-endopeptidase MepM/ murein hydrolase activator NlpD